MFDKILIANRGEIACRIMETARRLGVKSVAVYSEADATAKHVRLADEAYLIGGPAARDSYLKADVILEVAKNCGAQAIHPGYGFLSENAEFSEACAAAGIAFIGPSANSIRSMGLKDKAKDIMTAANVPVVPGYQGEEQGSDFLQQQADKVGYPLLIKAVAGGGGKGMRLVEASADFLAALESCQREAEASFGNAHVLLEKYLTKPRHIEVQVFGDSHGNVVHLNERDCSLQRRHQKVVEEAPAPGMSDEMRAQMGAAAVDAAKATDYCGAGTIEFIVDVEKGLDNAPFFFMEMNTRLQVEHPVTEFITGQDLVEWQLRVAAGEPLPLAQADVPLYGHAFEVRLYAEDPENEFLPQSGALKHFTVPLECRLDSGVEEGDEVSIHYDPMIAKIIVGGTTRGEALRKMRSVLEQTVVAPLKCNVEFLHKIFAHDVFASGDVDTGFIERYADDLIPDARPVPAEVLAWVTLNELNPQPSGQDPWDCRDGWQMNMSRRVSLVFLDRGEHREVDVTYRTDGLDCNVDGETLSLNTDAKCPYRIIKDGQNFIIFHAGQVSRLHLYLPGIEGDEEGGGSGTITTPMPGKILKTLVKEGDIVEQGQPLLILEAMKMEHTIKAPIAGSVEQMSLTAGSQVADGQILLKITEEEA